MSSFSDLLFVGCKLCSQACKLQKQLTHFMEERPSWETCSRAARPKILHFLWNTDVSCFVQSTASWMLQIHFSAISMWIADSSESWKRPTKLHGITSQLIVIVRWIHSTLALHVLGSIWYSLHTRCRHFEQSAAIRIVQFLNLEFVVVSQKWNVDDSGMWTG